MEKWINDSSGLRFINPYNFVSLGSDVQRTEPTDGKLTGKIIVRLIVKTPLAIPDTENVTTDAISHKTFPFFRVEGKPVIPGSQLRGMIRSAYETLSNSCFSVNNNNILSARHTNPARPGLIQFKDGAWHLYKAKVNKDYGQNINTNTDVRRMWYTLEAEKAKRRKENLNLSQKIKCKIFINTNDEEAECVNIEQAVTDYQNVIDLYDNQKTGNKLFKELKNQITYGIRKDGRLYPVFYETVEYCGETYVYLSPSQIGRYVFNKKLDDLLGTHASCSKRKAKRDDEEKKEPELCKACSLFGMISSTTQRAYASKLRFSDAQSTSFNSMGYVTLKELSSPKTTSVEFYSKRPENALYWTYDYKITSYKKEIVKKDKNGRQQTQTIPQREKCDVIIRGRKYYLHNPNLKPTDYMTTDRTNRNSTMELCDRKSQFTFDIFFEKITEEQLRELIWTITIGENNEDSLQMHKLGHGKPLGLGSVKLVVDAVQIRSFDADNRTYSVVSEEESKIDSYICSNPFFTEEMSDNDKKAFTEYMQLTNFNSFADVIRKKKADICPPIADDGGETANSKSSHQWFTANRSMGENGTSTAWSVKYILPVATSKNPTLPALVKVDDENSCNKSGKNKNHKK